MPVLKKDAQVPPIEPVLGKKVVLNHQKNDRDQAIKDV
jgi:hypothetical protein